MKYLHDALLLLSLQCSFCPWGSTQRRGWRVLEINIQSCSGSSLHRSFALQVHMKYSILINNIKEESWARNITHVRPKLTTMVRHTFQLCADKILLPHSYGQPWVQRKNWCDKNERGSSKWSERGRDTAKWRDYSDSLGQGKEKM